MSSEAQSPEKSKKPKAISITIDGETFEVEEKTLTAAEIIAVAGEDPATHYLVEVKGREQISYKDKPNEEIKVHHGSEFLTVPIGDETVS